MKTHRKLEYFEKEFAALYAKAKTEDVQIFLIAIYPEKRNGQDGVHVTNSTWGDSQYLPGVIKHTINNIRASPSKLREFYAEIDKRIREGESL